MKKTELKDVEIGWVFDASVETVWDSFTVPEIEKQWSRCFTPVISKGLEFIQHDFIDVGKFLHKAVVPWSKFQYIRGI
ncbi:MAG: hypothetical protein ACYCUZ_04145 [Cuniculiplasma sp.]|jgi:uncharacterized protein YndB with AHSA1/START domain